jgi:hypothetical protein
MRAHLRPYHYSTTLLPGTFTVEVFVRGNQTVPSASSQRLSVYYSFHQTL